MNWIFSKLERATLPFSFGVVALNFTSRLWSLPKSYPFCVELHLLCFDPLCDFIIALTVRIVNPFFKK